MKKWSAKRTRDIITIECPLEKNSSWEQYIFIIADQHFDSVHCDRTMMKLDMEKAKRRNAIILSGGDFFDAIGGKKDPRSTKSELRPEYCKTDYYSAIIDDAVSHLNKYADNMAVMCQGNHECQIIKNAEVDILKHTVDRLNDRAKSNIIQGEYEEFVRMSFVPPKNNKKKDTKYSKLFYLNHDYGGASPVTGGTIHHHRIAEFIKADFICLGHLHTRMLDERIWWEVTTQNTVIEKSCEFIRPAGYKLARRPGETTWETVKGIKPKPRGGVWIRFYWNTTTDNLEYEIIK